MNKKVKMLITLLLATLLIFSFAACDDSDNKDNKKDTYKIIFNANGGSFSLPSLSAKLGEGLPVLLAGTPIKEGHSFLGFYDSFDYLSGIMYYDAYLNPQEIVWDKTDNLYLFAAYKLIIEGSIDNPFIIADKNDLIKLADDVNDKNTFSDKYFLLTNDIDLQGYDWTPIGIDTAYFDGNFDGGNKTISNFTVSINHDNAGLFGRVLGTIKNLSVLDFNIESDSYSGGLIGYAEGAQITNCHSNGNIKGDFFAGGLIGLADNALITGCSAEDTINRTNAAGGLVGKISFTTIIDCNANCIISASNAAGGLVGDATKSIIKNSYASGKINSEYEAGGLISYAISTDISDCYSACDVYGDNWAGGLIGYASLATVKNSFSSGTVLGNLSGGLIGSASTSSISNCYSVSNVSAITLGIAGGLVGMTHNSTSISNCYATGNVSSDFMAGGLVAELSGSTISSCYASGNITIDCKSSFDIYIGGLVAYTNNDLAITSSFAIGNITVYCEYSTNLYIGGIIGNTTTDAANIYRYEGQIFNLKFNFEESDTPTNSIGIACPFTILDSLSFYTDNLYWDSEVWNFTNLDFAGNILPTLNI